ncbi:MAG: hypothetical protein K0S27_294 [Gammaproteobacteria bacterium]|jgi:hypothetical protein|nr:hypothetical protein [Gammaproteobacteria bacterium]
MQPRTIATLLTTLDLCLAEKKEEEIKEEQSPSHLMRKLFQGSEQRLPPNEYQKMSGYREQILQLLDNSKSSPLGLDSCYSLELILHLLAIYQPVFYYQINGGEVAASSISVSQGYVIPPSYLQNLFKKDKHDPQSCLANLAYNFSKIYDLPGLPRRNDHYYLLGVAKNRDFIQDSTANFKKGIKIGKKIGNIIAIAEVIAIAVGVFLGTPFITTTLVPLIIGIMSAWIALSCLRMKPELIKQTGHTGLLLPLLPLALGIAIGKLLDKYEDQSLQKKACHSSKITEAINLLGIEIIDHTPTPMFALPDIELNNENTDILFSFLQRNDIKLATKQAALQKSQNKIIDHIAKHYLLTNFIENMERNKKMDARSREKLPPNIYKLLLKISVAAYKKIREANRSSYLGHTGLFGKHKRHTKLEAASILFDELKKLSPDVSYLTTHDNLGVFNEGRLGRITALCL